MELNSYGCHPGESAQGTVMAAHGDRSPTMLKRQAARNAAKRMIAARDLLARVGPLPRRRTSLRQRCGRVRCRVGSDRRCVRLSYHPGWRLRDGRPAVDRPAHSAGACSWRWLVGRCLSDDEICGSDGSSVVQLSKYASSGSALRPLRREWCYSKTSGLMPDQSRQRPSMAVLVPRLRVETDNQPFRASGQPAGGVRVR